MWIETERMYTRRQPTGRCHVAWDASGRIPKDSCAVAFFIHLPNKDVGFGPKILRHGWQADLPRLQNT